VARETRSTWAFRYSRQHDSAAVDGYAGCLVADAHSVYDHLHGDGAVTEVGCWSHARRYFFKTLGSEPERAREALALIGEMLFSRAQRDRRGRGALFLVFTTSADLW